MYTEGETLEEVLFAFFIKLERRYVCTGIYVFVKDQADTS